MEQSQKSPEQLVKDILPHINRALKLIDSEPVVNLLPERIYSDLRTGLQDSKNALMYIKRYSKRLAKEGKRYGNGRLHKQPGQPGQAA